MRKGKLNKMSDDIDLANEHIQKTMELSLKSIDTSTAPPNVSNRCLWCQEPIREKDERRWCSPECRDAYASSCRP